MFDNLPLPVYSTPDRSLDVMATAAADLFDANESPEAIAWRLLTEVSDARPAFSTLTPIDVDGLSVVRSAEFRINGFRCILQWLVGGFIALLMPPIFTAA